LKLKHTLTEKPKLKLHRYKATQMTFVMYDVKSKLQPPDNQTTQQINQSISQVILYTPYKSLSTCLVDSAVARSSKDP